MTCESSVSGVESSVSVRGVWEGCERGGTVGVGWRGVCEGCARGVRRV